METMTWKEYLEYLLKNSPYRSEQEKLKEQIKRIDDKEKIRNNKLKEKGEDLK